MSQRKAVTKRKALAYRAGKTRILNELVELTGWHRDYAPAALRDALVIKPVCPGRPRARVYGDDLLPALGAAVGPGGQDSGSVHAGVGAAAVGRGRDHADR